MSKVGEIEVTLSRNYIYPSSVLDPSNKREDAIYKAVSDFLYDVSSIPKPEENIDMDNIISFFETNIKEKDIIKTKRPVKINNDKGSIRGMGLETLIRKLAKVAFEEKHGSIDIEENPSIYDIQKNENGEVLYHYLKTEFEEIWHELIAYYDSAIYKIFN